MPSLLAAYQPYKMELLGKMFGFPAQAVGGEHPISSIPKESGILGIGVGAKFSGGTISSPDLAIRVYVRAKHPVGDLAGAAVIPSNINGKVTDVIAVGDIAAGQVSCGVSVGHQAITAGTLGCLVKQADDGASVYILSNNHVLANSNTAMLGDPILQPGPLDGGAPPPIAHLTAFEPIKFNGIANHIDAAIAKLDSVTSVTPDILKIGRVVNPPVLGKLYQSVRKHGRTTLHTVGIIVGLSEDINVRYGNQVAAFEDQLAIIGAGSVFSQGGDSGSLIVDAVSLNPVGLLFAGGGQQTFANPIGSVLSRFNASIM